MASQPNGPTDSDSQAPLEAARRAKLRKIQELGLDPWGKRFDGHAPIGQIRAREGEIVVEPTGDSQPGNPPEPPGPAPAPAAWCILNGRAERLMFVDIRDWT